MAAMFHRSMSIGNMSTNRIVHRKYGMDIGKVQAERLQSEISRRAGDHEGMVKFSHLIEVVGVDEQTSETSIVEVAYPLIEDWQMTIKQIESGIFAILAEIEYDVKRARRDVELLAIVGQ